MRHLLILLFLLTFPETGRSVFAQDASTLISELPLDSLIKAMGWKSMVDSSTVRQMEAQLNKRKKRAKVSDAELLFKLYTYYNLGLGTPIDREKAFDYCRRSALLGYGPAQNDLGNFYEFGWTVLPNDSLALHYYHLAAEQEIPIALFNLGRMYLDDPSGTYRDTLRASAYLRTAAELGHHPALLRMGAYYFLDTIPADYSRAASYFRKASEWGCKESAYCLGTMYLEGLGVPPDTLQAVYWCALSADQGYEPAQSLLAGFYYEGKGIGVDFSKAAYYYSFLAEKGDPESQYWLGASLWMQRKCEESLHWFLRAAEQDHVSAQKHLAHGYDVGLCGFESSREQSLYWGERAARLGDVQSQCYVGANYLESAVDSIRKRGEYYLLSAVETENAMAQYCLGRHYLKKAESDSLLRQGVEYLIHAAEKGLTEARIELGQAYAGGYGCPRSGWEDSLNALLPRARKGNIPAIHSVAGHYCALLNFEKARYWFSKLAYRSPKLERLLKYLP